MSETVKPKEKMEPGSGKKRVRQRKLSLYDNIRKQMEFYFSTPNLQKDRFLKKLVMSDPDGFVELEMFLNFNKIKALTTDLVCIAKAIKESKTLMVDETGKKIKRKCKFEEPQDTDQRTVYAEFLPKDTTIDWLIKHFSQVGKVVHVSLPKYKSTGDIKGFAFVEFETVEAAAKACQLLNCPPEKMSDSKPGIFAKTFKTGRHMKKALPQDSDIPEAMETGGSAPEVKVECEDLKANDLIKEEKMEVEGSTCGQEAHVPKEKTKKKKRKRSESFSGQKESKTSEDVESEAIDEIVEPDTTKDDDKLEASKENVVDKNKSKKKRKRSESCETVQRMKVEKLEEPEEVQESTTKKKKPKFAKVKEEVKDGEENDAKKPEPAESSDRSGTENTPKKKPAKKKAKQGIEQKREGLRVISKQEWLEYRQDYYQRHKQNMSELKMKIREIKGEQKIREIKGEQKVREIKGEQKLVDQPKTTLASNGDSSEAVSNQPIKKEEGLTFVPGVIVKVTLAEPVSKKFLKEHMSGSGKVAFLDMVEGDSTAHARCEDVESAASIIKTSTQECQYTLLQGEEEKTYWDKVFSDREKRLSTKTKKKVRGNDKILAKADKVLRSIKEKAVHIVFED